MIKLSTLLFVSAGGVIGQIGVPLADDNGVTWSMRRHEVEAAIKQKPSPAPKNDLQYEVPLGIFRVVVAFDFVDSWLVRIRCTPVEREDAARVFKVWHLELKTKHGLPQPQIRSMGGFSIDNRSDYAPDSIVYAAAKGQGDFRYIWKVRETQIEQYVWRRHELLKTGLAYTSLEKAYTLSKLDPL
jgi:hypothetical protein